MVSIITINYNQTQVTCELLQSLKALTYPNYEVIVVDNASTENPEQIIKQQFPNVQVIVSTTNLGFSGGNNLGMTHAKGDYFFLVNNDTELTPNCIEQLLAMYQKIPNLGIVCPKIRYFEAAQPIQYVGYTKLNPITARNHTIGQYEPDNGQYQQATQTPYAHGAAMMVSRQAVEKVGMMPEDFFLYYEELDWSEQMKRAGYKIYVEPQATIFHKESVSTGKDSPLKTYYLTRNRILFMRRNATGIMLLLFFLYTLLIMIPKNLLTLALQHQTQHLKAFWQGIMWHFLNYKL